MLLDIYERVCGTIEIQPTKWTAFDMYGVALSARLPGSTIQKYRRTPEITAAAGGLERLSNVE